MCICDGCGKLIESKFIYCPWCGYSRVAQEKEEAQELRVAKIKQQQRELRLGRIEKMEEELEALEKELNVLVLSAEMAR